MPPATQKTTPNVTRKWIARCIRALLTITYSKVDKLVDWATANFRRWHRETGWSGMLLLGGKNRAGEVECFVYVSSSFQPSARAHDQQAR